MWQAINDFFSYIRQLLSTGQPWVLYVLLLIVIASLLFILWQLRRAKQKPENPETDQQNKTSISKKLRNWLYFIKVEIRFLFLPRKHNYRDPWYLVLGASDPSGQDQLLGAMASELKPYLNNHEKAFHTPKSKWHFFKQGVIIAVKERLFSGTSTADDKASWCDLLDQIHYYRPERPLDGILINLSADVLGSNSHLLSAHLSNVRRALWQLQQQYDFALPVYMVVNHCESVSGFSAFCDAIPVEQQQQIFGWSNGARVDQALDLSQMYQEFNIVHDVLTDQVLGLAASDKQSVETDTDALMMLPYEFAQLQVQLIDVVGQILKESDPNNAFFVRGIYFTGAGKSSKSPFFVKDLFNQKIFAEDSLAYPTNSGTRSHNRRLTRFRALFVTTMLIVATWFGFEFVSLQEQGKTIVKAHEDMQQEYRTNTSSENKVYPILRGMADMNASQLSRLSMPVSLINSLDNDVSQYLSEEVFIGVIFPALEAKIIARGRQLLNTQIKLVETPGYPSEPFVQWLVDIQDFTRAIKTFQALSVDHQDREQVDVLVQFSELTDYLYKEALPSQFKNNSELYKTALERVCYPKKVNDECLKVSQKLSSFKKLAYVQINERLFEYAKAAKANIINDSRYPGDLFTIIKQINLSPSKSSVTDISNELPRFARWFERKRENWLANPADNPCELTEAYVQTFKATIREEDVQLLSNLENAIGQFSDANCFTPALQKLQSQEYAEIGTLFKESGSLTGQIKPLVAGLIESIPHLQSLSFFKAGEVVLSEHPGENYFWDPKALSSAFDFYADYERFTIQQSGIQTDHVETADNIAKSLLHLAMYNKFLNARLPEKVARGTLAGFSTSTRAVSAEQQLLAQKVKFFRKSQQHLADLPGLFNQLDFTETGVEVASVARLYSMSLLRAVDDMASNSRLYAVNEKLLWMQANLVSALFGISQPQMLKGYLFSQREASNNLVLNYATPALQFILNSDYPFKIPMIAKDEEIFSRWYETSVQANKHQTNNPNNSIQRLEDVFNNQLLGMTQSNCFAKVSELIKPAEVDLFSRAQGDIVDAAAGYCDKYNVDVIKREYATVAQQFNRYLRGKFPFVNKDESSHTQVGSDQEADLGQVQNFFKRYQVENQGLAQRMFLVARKQRGYRQATTFLEQLDEVAKLLAPNLTQATDFKQTAIGTKAQFRVQVEAGHRNPAIIHWQLGYDGDSVSSPGQNELLNWHFGNNVDLTLRWSDNADVLPLDVPKPCSGLRPLINESSKQVTFQYHGKWALLRLIANHTSNLKDPSAATDSEANVLGFCVDQMASKDRSPAATARAYLRLSLFGVNPETGLQETLKVPADFPASAPIIPNH